MVHLEVAGKAPSSRRALPNRSEQGRARIGHRSIRSRFHCCSQIAGATRPLGPHEDARYVAVSPNRQWAVTGGFGTRGATVWRTATGERVQGLPRRLRLPLLFSARTVSALVTSTSSSAGGAIFQIRVWEAGTWAEVLLKKPAWGSFPAFSPDGKLLAAGSGDGAAVLLNPETGAEYARLEDPTLHRADNFSFSPDGTKLVTASLDGNCLHVWDLQALRRRLRAMDLDWD